MFFSIFGTVIPKEELRFQHWWVAVLPKKAANLVIVARVPKACTLNPTP